MTLAGLTQQYSKERLDISWTAQRHEVIDPCGIRLVQHGMPIWFFGGREANFFLTAVIPPSPPAIVVGIAVDDGAAAGTARLALSSKLYFFAPRCRVFYTCVYISNS